MTVFKSEILPAAFCARKMNTQLPLSLLRLADAALRAAGKANKGATPEAADAFLRVQEEMVLFGLPPPRKDSDAPGDHRKRLLDPNIALANASKKDEKSISILSKVKSVFPTPVSHLS